MRILSSFSRILFCSALLFFGCSNSSTSDSPESRGAGGNAGGLGGATATAGSADAEAGSAGSNTVGVGGEGGGSDSVVAAAGAAQAGAAGAPSSTVEINVTWKEAIAQAATWYAGDEAAAVASNVLYYQNADGGWPKNIDVIGKTSAEDASTFDNDATTTELAFLAKMYTATGDATYLDAFNLGIDLLLDAQYPDNGGWPQHYPDATGYQAHITYNDDVMTNIMALLRDVGNKREPAYTFVDDERATRALAAVDLGIQCIINTQIVVDGVKSVWCAQHDQVTLLPAPARTYELISNSGSEGAGVLSFLMTIDSPSADVIEAVQAGVAWFNRVKLEGIRVTEVVTDAGEDVVVVADSTAPPIWARFYELGTDVPFFCGRDGIKKYSLAEIELERRTGYRWYGDWGIAVLTSYPAWQEEWAPDQNVLETST